MCYYLRLNTQDINHPPACKLYSFFSSNIPNKETYLVIEKA